MKALDKYIKGSIININPKILYIIDIQSKYGRGINYDKAWRAREFDLSSIASSLEEFYSALPSYCYLLEKKNLGTITDIVINQDNRFKYFFMALGGCIS